MSLQQTLRFILGHPMNKGRPISTLTRFAKWQLQSRIKDEVIFNWIDGAKLVVRRGMTGATGNIYCGLHEYIDMRYVLDTLKPGDLFVDIGANIGSYTILASKVCGANTVAIEPDPETVRSLRRNIEVNGLADKVRIVEAALGSKTGTTSFTIGRDTVNRVARQDDTNVRILPLKTLDEVLDGEVPTLIKIDVEGYEGEVLRGGAVTLGNPKLRAIITETLDRDVQDILEQAGFKKAYYYPEQRAFGETASGHSNNSLMTR